MQSMNLYLHIVSKWDSSKYCMDDFWNTGYDPFLAIEQCQRNIEQCVIAINTGSELMRELGQKYLHQQQVIQQLSLNNRRLQAQIDQIRRELEQLKQQKLP